jgi:membrane-bound lytic murein transglycosylase A
MTHMTIASRHARVRAAAAILGIVGAALLAACSNTAPPAPGEPADALGGRSGGGQAPSSSSAASPVAPADGIEPPAIERTRSRWVPVPWSDLPGWRWDRTGEFWPAFLRSCERPAAGWLAACAEARRSGPGAAAPDEAVREWLQQRLQPHRVEAHDRDPSGLATGYFEPLIAASRTPRPGFQVALHAPPADLGARKPYWTRRDMETSQAARSSLRGHEIAWVPDRLDALLLQIQGSGRLAIAESGRRPTLVRVAYAGQNEHPYKSVGRWLIDQGELRPGEASWPAIRAWARQNPARVDAMLWSNPRVVFFREEPLPDPSVGPKGAQGVPLTPGRSIAVDPLSVPYGTPVWLDTTEPLSSTPLRRLVVAQDTGSAITGAVRADYFWGWGESAEAQAGRMKQPLRMWVLWPAPGKVSAGRPTDVLNTGALR